MDPVYQWGRRMRRFVQNEGYAFAPDAFDTWLSGGCLLLARTLADLIGPECRIVAIGSSCNSHEHVVVEYRGWYLDGDGASRRETLLRRWQDVEGLPEPRLVEFNPSCVADWFYDADASAKLCNALRETVGLPS